MRWILLSVLCLTGSHAAWAARVCLEKTTGKLIEYQSQATPGTLLRNAEASGYTADQVEEREVTPEAWAAIREEWIVKPARERRKDREADQRKKAQAMKQKLGFSDQEFDDLRDALGDR